MAATPRFANRRVRIPFCLAGLLVGAATLPTITGCRAALPRDASQTEIPADTNAELVEYISDQPFVTAEAAYRAIYILDSGTIFDGDYAALQAELETRGIVAGDWSYAENQCLDRAAIGRLVARACDIRTGINWQLTGLGRYGYRELIYRRIAHPGGEYGLVSGGEFLGVLARAEEYLHDVGRPAGESAELGGEPAGK